MQYLMSSICPTCPFAGSHKHLCTNSPCFRVFDPATSTFGFVKPFLSPLLSEHPKISESPLHMREPPLIATNFEILGCSHDRLWPVCDRVIPIHWDAEVYPLCLSVSSLGWGCFCSMQPQGRNLQAFLSKLIFFESRIVYGYSHLKEHSDLCSLGSDASS